MSTEKGNSLRKLRHLEFVEQSTKEAAKERKTENRILSFGLNIKLHV